VYTTTLPALPATDIRQFMFDAATRSFVAEISDTNGLGRVWADSIDEGLSVRGATGALVTFVVDDEHRDADGDLTHWTLVSYSGLRADGRYTMTLFND
jgi:hypothetical protein